ncbi:hypothetical protein PSTT_16269, partial [Puccinia striiformis]
RSIDGQHRQAEHNIPWPKLAQLGSSYVKALTIALSITKIPPVERDEQIPGNISSSSGSEGVETAQIQTPAKLYGISPPADVDKKTNLAAVVDPCEPKEIIKQPKLKMLFLCSKHNHSGGNVELASFLQENVTSKDKVKVYGGSKKIPGLTTLLSLGEKKEGDDNGQSIEVTCLATPCHTGDSICYHLKDPCQGGPGCVFTGDTLFVAGCGRFFEGTAEEMDQALNQRLSSLPDETVTYVGHEYTKSNAAFAKSIEPKNEHLLSLIKVCDSLKEITTGKYTIGDEKKFNPFMRLEEPDVISATGLSSPSRVEVMTKLRELKNSFKA